MVIGQKITPEMIAALTQNTLENQETITQSTNERQQKDKGTAEGNFIGYCYFEKGTGKVQVTQPPTAKSGKTNSGGQYFMQSMTVILRDIVPCSTIKVVNDHTYNVFVKVRYADQKTKDYIIENKLDPYYDSKSNGVVETLYREIANKASYDVTLMTFEERAITALTNLDAKTGQLKIRPGKRVKLTGLSAQVYARVYDVDVGKGDDITKETRFSDQFSFQCSGIQLVPDNSTEIVSLAKTYHNIYNKNEYVCVDMKDVHLNNAQLPSNAYFWFPSDDNYVSPDMSLVRVPIKSSDKQDFLKNFGNDLFPTKVQARFCSKDFYTATGKRFVNKVTMYKEACSTTGLDTENENIWADLMLAHKFSSHIVCSLSVGGTESLTLNQSAVVESRPDDSNPEVTHGTYVWNGQQWIIDWEDTLANRGIEIDKKTFLDTFKEANKKLARKDKKFTIPTVDGENEFKFVSVLSYENPVVTDGMLSKVIPFGSGARPTFSCEDATPIIESKTTRFYALTGVSKEDCAEWDTVKKGSAVFNKQLKDVPELSYSLFAIQNCEPRGKKKK